MHSASSDTPQQFGSIYKYNYSAVFREYGLRGLKYTFYHSK